jgi:HEAT repeat protein
LAIFDKKFCALLAAFVFLMFPDASNSRQSNGGPAAENAKHPPNVVETTKPVSVDAAWALLDEGVNSNKFRNRSDALSALTILDHDRKALAIIANALDDKEEMIRVLAATSLGEIKARSKIRKLRQAMDDKSPEVSFAAAQALWKMGDPSGRDIFYDVLDGDRKVKPGIIKSKLHQARMDMHDPKALALIGVNEVSGAFLGPFSMGVSMVEEYAKNTGTSVQALCAQLLATDDSRRTTDNLTDALGDKNWAVRAAAARSLAKLDYHGAMPQLKDMMENDKSQPVRFTAAAAVIRLSGHPRSGAAAGASSPAPSQSTTTQSTSEPSKAH